MLSASRRYGRSVRWREMCTHFLRLSLTPWDSCVVIVFDDLDGRIVGKGRVFEVSLDALDRDIRIHHVAKDFHGSRADGVAVAEAEPE